MKRPVMKPPVGKRIASMGASMQVTGLINPGLPPARFRSALGVPGSLICLGLLLGLYWPAQINAAEIDSAPPARPGASSEAGKIVNAAPAPAPAPAIVETGEAELGSDGSEEEDEFGVESAIDHSGIEEMTIQGAANSSTLAADAAESAVQFDAEELGALGATDISDIAKVTPNLEITKAGATSANFFIRGVGLADYSANSASAVAIYQNGVPLNSAALQLVGLFDVASVDVLRGPQGAGSGRSASAGAIKITSRKPTGEYNAQLKVSMGAYESDVALNALIQDYEGAVEMPLVEDLLSARIAFRARAADPYMTNGCGNAPPFSERVPATNQLDDASSICGERVFFSQPGSISQIPLGLPTAVGDQGNWALRGLFRLEPEGADTDWLLSVHGGRLDQQSSLGQAMGTQASLGIRTSAGYFEPDQRAEWLSYRDPLVASGVPDSEAQAQASALLANNLVTRPLDLGPYRGDYNRVGQTTRDTWGTSLNGRIFLGDFGRLGEVELETISAYDGYSRSRDTDQDFTPDVLFEIEQDDEGWQLFQELKATSESPDGSLRGELGGYFLMEELEYSSLSKTFDANIDALRTFEQSVKSFAVYAGVDWDFLDDFSLNAGARYNYEDKSFDLTKFTLFGQIAVGGEAPQQRSVWTAPTGLLSLTYRFSDEVSAYWKYSRGWKGGHYNANTPGAPPADPETVDSIEAGVRGAWFDNRMRLSGAVFYYSYQNYQLFLFENAIGSPPILEVINAGDAQQYGAELELDFMPLMDREHIPEFWGDLQVSLRAGWLNSQFLNFVNTIEVLRGTSFQQEEVVYTGNQLPNAPEFKVSGSLEWPFDLGRFGTFAPRYDFAWSSDIFFDANEGRGNDPDSARPIPAMTIAQPAFALHNLRFTWREANGNIEISGWVRNLTDVRYKTFAFDASIFANVILNFVGEPRTAGADITFRF
jgi:iron complex outermembrane receptor protein